MQRRTSLALALATLLAIGGTAIAQNAPTSAPAVKADQAKAPIWHHDAPPTGFMGMHHQMHQRDGGVIGDLHALSRLYLLAGRSKEMAAVYQDVLAKSQDPRVRDYAYHHLARLQAMPSNVDQAISTLKKSLNENLANAAKVHAERAKMRADWQSRNAAPAAPAAK